MRSIQRIALNYERKEVVLMSDIEKIEEVSCDHVEIEDVPAVDEAIHVEVVQEQSDIEPGEES
jgi:hypothetical protein